jgi:hypothetical protein
MSRALSNRVSKIAEGRGARLVGIISKSAPLAAPGSATPSISTVQKPFGNGILYVSPAKQSSRSIMRCNQDCTASSREQRGNTGHKSSIPSSILLAYSLCHCAWFRRSSARQLGYSLCQDYDAHINHNSRLHLDYLTLVKASPFRKRPTSCTSRIC